MKKVILVGSFAPDDSGSIFNDECAASVLVRKKMGFNDEDAYGVIELVGTDGFPADAEEAEDDMGTPPQYMTAKAARELAALLLKAADISEGMQP